MHRVWRPWCDARACQRRILGTTHMPRTHADELARATRSCTFQNQRPKQAGQADWLAFAKASRIDDTVNHLNVFDQISGWFTGNINQVVGDIVPTLVQHIDHVNVSIREDG